MSDDKKIDYLEVDDQIPGQNFVCLSFVSPEALIESKESFKVSKFLQAYCKDKDLEVNKVMEEYNSFTYKYQDELQKDFDERNKFQTNIRGLKVRGCYNTKEEATSRAEKLQKLDSDFHVFVGQVGYWLPWDPCADKVEDEKFIDSQLNEMMEKYKENNINKDIFYEDQKREKVKAAREEAIRKQKENDERIKKEKEEKEEKDNKYGSYVIGESNLDGNDNSSEPIAEGEGNVDDEPISEAEEKVDLSKSIIQETVKSIKEEDNNVEQDIKDIEEVVSENVDEIISEKIEEVVNNKLDSDLKDSLNEEDPWLKNKLNKDKEA